MGLFDWLFRRARLRLQVWLDDAGCAAGIGAAVRDGVQRDLHVVVVAHFPDALVAAGQRLAADGVAFETLTRWTARDDDRLASERTPRVVVLLASALPEPTQQRIAADTTLRLRVIAVELHVLAAANERVRRFAAERPVHGDAIAFVSFDSPHAARMMSPAVRTMMTRMGMRPDQPIDSPMVARSMDRALQKLARRVKGDAPAESLDRWLQRNLSE